MNKFSQVLTITTALLVLLTACAGGAPGTDGKTVVVTPAIKGNSAILNAGDKLEVQLPTIPKARQRAESARDGPTRDIPNPGVRAKTMRCRTSP